MTFLKILFFSSIIFCILSIWLYNKNEIKFNTILDIRNSYDYIIGGGTSGCVLASKLSENPLKSVLLIEAGGEFNFLATVPLIAVLLQQTSFDWTFKSVPQKFSSFGLQNQSQCLPRGKGLGGSNQINYMVHGDDIKDELEKWKQRGIENWNYQTIYSLFQTLFSNITENNTKLSNLLNEAAKNLNISYFPVRNLINNGKRWTSFHSHLLPVIKRKNLHILLNSQVIKIKFTQNKRAVGVEILNNKIIYSSKEIILCAGAFNTPQILFLSGIGSTNILNNFRIPTIVNLPGVGKNLHDHLNFPLYVSINKNISVTMDKVLKFSEFWNYIMYKKGVLSTTPNSGFVRKDDVGVLLFAMGSTDENLFRKIANIKYETFKNMFPFYKNTSHEGFVLLSTCLKPKSKGFVSLQSSDPQKLVLVNPQYLTKYYDVECMIRAIKLAMEIVNSTVFKNIGAEINWPIFSECPSFYRFAEYLECVIRIAALTGYHPGGTCRMGTLKEQFSVVDNELKVKGVHGLRIVDASILPEPLPTFPNSFFVVLAEYAAKYIIN